MNLRLKRAFSLRSGPHEMFFAPAQPNTVPAPTRWRFAYDVLWVLLGSTAMGTTQWVCILVLGRVASPSEIGGFTLAYAVGAPFVMAANGQLRQILAADVRSGTRFADYFALRLVSVVLAISVTIAAARIARLSTAIFSTVVLIAVAKGAEALSDLCYGLYQAAGRSSAMGRSMLLRAAVSAATGVLVSVAFKTAHSAAAGLAVASILVYLLYDLPRTVTLVSVIALSRSRHALGGPILAWRPRCLGQLARAAIPLGLAAGLAALTWNLPRYFLQTYHGVHDLGIFSVLSVAPLAMSALPGALGQIIGPSMAEARAIGQLRAARKTLIVTALASAGLALVCAGLAHLWGAAALRIVFGPEYSQFSPALALLFAASAPQYVLFCLNAAFVAGSDYSAQLRALVPTVVISLGLGWVLIPTLGVNGAIALFAAGNAIQVSISIWLTARLSAAQSAAEGQRHRSPTTPVTSISDTERLADDEIR